MKIKCHRYHFSVFRVLLHSIWHRSWLSQRECFYQKHTVHLWSKKQEDLASLTEPSQKLLQVSCFSNRWPQPPAALSWRLSRTHWCRKLAETILLLLSRSSCGRLCATTQTAARRAPLSLGFSRQEHWGGLPFPPPETIITTLLLVKLVTVASVSLISWRSGTEAQNIM